MPKNSKGQKNGLTFYILTEIIPELQRKGERHPNGMRDLVPLAMPRWQNLSKEQRTIYENMAKADRLKQRENNVLPAHSKLRDNLGNVVDERTDPKEQMKAKRQQEKMELKATFQNLTDAELMEEKFYLIGFQYMICTEEHVYYPLEYGVVEWCMAKGVTNTLHGFINPTDIPLGYRFSAQAHSDDTHRIPLEEFSKGDSDYRGIWLQLERFLKSDSGYSNPAPVYCLAIDYPVITGCLSWLQHQSAMGNCFRVNVLEELATALFVRKGFQVSDASVVEFLTTTTYDFEANTKCYRHDEVEAKHCALGLPKKYTYALSDSLADFYKFPLTANHLPVATVNDSTAIVTADNCKLIPYDPMGRGQRKTTVEPVSYASRDIRYFPSDPKVSPANPSFGQNTAQDKKQESDNNYDDDDEDQFPSLQATYAPGGRGPSQPDTPSRFANYNMKAPAPSSLPNPSAAFLQPRAKSEAYPWNNEDLEDRMHGIRMQDDRGDAPQREKMPSRNLTLSSIAASLNSGGMKPTAELQNQAVGETFNASNQANLPLGVSAPAGRGRGFAEYPRLPQTPSRVGAIRAQSEVNTMSFSPVGRGRAFVSLADSESGLRRPPPGFGVRTPRTPRME